MDPKLAQTLKFDANGLIPAIIQDSTTGEVLMMAWMNKEALEKTLETGKTHFFSRSRNKQWLKGESSGHVQHVRSIAVDCDADVLLIKVAQVGAACHDGYYSCFYREYKPTDETPWKVIGRKVFDPERVYR
jgi:phosphoribosyl-AMP cyclohydrolase